VVRGTVLPAEVVAVCVAISGRRLDWGLVGNPGACVVVGVLPCRARKCVYFIGGGASCGVISGSVPSCGDEKESWVV